MKLSMQTVANALELPASKVERWIRQGRIPLQHSGSEVVFSKTTMEKWAALHHLPFFLVDAPADHRSPEPLGSLVAAMKKGKVFHRVAGADPNSALRSAVNAIDFLSPDAQYELFEKLVARERLASTGIGNGIAIPHPRDPLSQPPEWPAITTCFLKKPIDFNAIDDQPVFVCFLLISPTVKHHLHLLSRLSYCIRDKAFVAFLNAHPDAADLYSRVAVFEKQLDDL